MKPFTKTGEGNCQEDLRFNWRGNACSKHRDKYKKAKGKCSVVCDDGKVKLIGNKNYRRKKFDRENKHSYRTRLKEELKKELKDL